MFKSVTAVPKQQGGSVHPGDQGSRSPQKRGGNHVARHSYCRTGARAAAQFMPQAQHPGGQDDARQKDMHHHCRGHCTSQAREHDARGSRECCRHYPGKRDDVDVLFIPKREIDLAQKAKERSRRGYMYRSLRRIEKERAEQEQQFSSEEETEEGEPEDKEAEGEEEEEEANQQVQYPRGEQEEKEEREKKRRRGTEPPAGAQHRDNIDLLIAEMKREREEEEKAWAEEKKRLREAAAEEVQRRAKALAKLEWMKQQREQEKWRKYQAERQEKEKAEIEAEKEQQIKELAAEIIKNKAAEKEKLKENRAGRQSVMDSYMAGDKPAYKPKGKGRRNAQPPKGSLHPRDLANDLQDGAPEASPPAQQESKDQDNMPQELAVPMEVEPKQADAPQPAAPEAQAA